MSVPPPEDAPPQSMDSFVMCSSRAPAMVELKSLVEQIREFTLGTVPLAESGELASIYVCVSVCGCACVCMYTWCMRAHVCT